MTARLKKVPLTIFQRFFRTETLGGLVLLGFGLAALAIAGVKLIYRCSMQRLDLAYWLGYWSANHLEL